MPSVSIFTPSHSSKYLPQLYESLKQQSDPKWSWTIGHNNGGRRLETNDPRVKQHMLDDDKGWVGPLKAKCCELADGDILMEVDNDDVLMPTAITECKAAFEDPAVGFAYSNALHADGDLTSSPARFSEQFGWHYRQTEYNGRMLDEPISFGPSPAAVSRIWYAPNHFRAFRRSVYEKIGGYARDMRVLDDQDLMSRMYLETEFKHIDSAQYVYRVHGENSWLKHNAEIQANVHRLHDLYAEKLACKWAEREGLRKLELGGRFNKHAGYESVDLRDSDVNCNLEEQWPIVDASVGVIRAFDVFEHLRDPIHTMSECFRVLAPGGWIFAQVPSTDGRGAFQDPTHRSQWNLNSWLYYSHQNWARYIDVPCRFQAARVFDTAPDARGVIWTCAHLISLKNNHRPPGIIEI